VGRYYGVGHDESREIVNGENSGLRFRSTWVM
jgi:hypothetical protein